MFNCAQDTYVITITTTDLICCLNICHLWVLIHIFHILQGKYD